VRTQRRAPVDVTLVHVTSTTTMGDTDATATGEEVKRALFDPAQQILERAGDTQAVVVQPAVFNLPGIHTLDVHDLIQEGIDLDPDHLLDIGDGTWQVVGGSAVFLDRTKVPVVQARRT
jgi:hypothetical protein